MRKIKKVLSLVIIAVVMFLTLAGCTKSKHQSAVGTYTYQPDESSSFIYVIDIRSDGTITKGSIRAEDKTAPYYTLEFSEKWELHDFLIIVKGYTIMILDSGKELAISKDGYIKDGYITFYTRSSEVIIEYV